ncbi:hypothetical protein [Xenophilus sp.]|uniref:hypothetical protein n=1 Tax=Xenophilus sp. TaxID=1873499 RepID=UPI0037DDD0BE
MTNTTFRACPWADVLYALDRAWWDKHLDEAKQVFSGLLASPQKIPGVQRIMNWVPRERTNSGAMALVLAAYWGARRIVMLGYDCQHTDGKTHWHGSHPDGLGDARGVENWPAQFRAISMRLTGAEVVNASRVSALELFKRTTLEGALQ